MEFKIQARTLEAFGDKAKVKSLMVKVKVNSPFSPLGPGGHGEGVKG